MRIHVPFSLVRRVLLAAVAVALLTPPTVAGAASDPLAVAVARVTAAEKADNRATAAFESAQTRYYELQDEQASTQRTILTLTGQQQHLAALGRARAVVAYKRGSLMLDDVLGNGSDILDAARRATMLNGVNARGEEVLAQLAAVTGELHDHQTALRDETTHAKSALATMKTQERDAERALAAAGQAERDLRAQLAAQRRVREASAILAAARAQADSRSASNASSGGGTAGQIIVRGNWVCPVQGPVSFTDTFGAPRGGGRRHQGNDMFSPGGTPLVAVTNGSVFFQSDRLGGLAAYVQGHDGNTYYYAHLSDYVGGARSVNAGELIGHVGNTGDASGGPTHLHFEIRPGGPNGRAIDPYATLAAHC